MLVLIRASALTLRATLTGSLCRSAPIRGLDGATELVLDGFEEGHRFFLGGLVVGSKGEDFANPQIDPALAGADVADALKKLVEVVGYPFVIDGRVLEPLVIHGEPFDEIFPQALGGPAAKLGSPGRADAEADRQNGIEIVVFDVSADVSSALLANL